MGIDLRGASGIGKVGKQRGTDMKVTSEETSGIGEAEQQGV